MEFNGGVFYKSLGSIAVDRALSSSERRGGGQTGEDCTRVLGQPS